MMNKNLDRIEAQLRSLFEHSLLKLFTGNQNTNNLIDDLISVMQKNLIEQENGKTLAPDQFELAVSKEDLIEWQAHQDVLNEIAEALFQTGMKYGFVFHTRPHIQLKADRSLAAQRHRITAEFTPPEDKKASTAAMEAQKSGCNGAGLPEDASLIIRGRHAFPLAKPVINIGRHSDNDLVLNDKYVSRHHAQLRAINQQFVIFDLGSSAGILLNGRAIRQATLQPGDVIRLGEVNLIYIQESTGAHATSAIPIETKKETNGDDPG